MSRLTRRAPLVAAAAALSIVAAAVGAGAASASHFRASGPDFSVTGDTATWEVTTAWATNDHSTFVGLGSTTPVRAISSYSDVPGSGTDTGVSLEVISEVESDEPLYAQVVETFQGDLSTLPDGLYEVYVENCCRVSDIVNSIASDFSQWVRFSKTGSTYAVAPRLTSPVIYAPLSVVGTTTLISYAAPGAVTWTTVESGDGPYYGSSALPCSTFAGGALEIGAEHCTGGDVYTEIYLPGTFWAFKTTIADADGRQSVAETLFRVETVPAPYIDRHAWTEGGRTAQFWAYAEDVVVSSWTMTCTNVDTPADVRTGTATALPITVTGFTAAETYDCVVAATNGAGTGTTDPGNYEVTSPDLSLELEFEVGDFYAGSTALLQGAGLDPESPYTLTMYSDPILLDEGYTDVDGAFSNELVVPQEACIPGAHELRLVGLSGGEEVSASQTIEIDASCLVVTINGVGAQLAATGPRTIAPSAVLFGLALLLGGALLASYRAPRRAFRSLV